MDTDLTVEAQARADLAVEIIEQIDDEGLPAGLLPLLRRLFADDYEIAYGRGYDQGHEDGTFAPRAIDLGTPTVLQTPRPLEVSQVGRRWEAALRDLTERLGLACATCSQPVYFAFHVDPLTVSLVHTSPHGGITLHDVTGPVIR